MGPDRNQSAVEVVMYYVERRDRTPERDRLTARMEAKQIVNALDLMATTAPDPDRLTCVECGRRGKRGFIILSTQADRVTPDQVMCESRAACERRQRQGGAS